MAFVYLGMGTNLGDKVKNLDEAIEKLSLGVGLMLKKSTYIVSKAWGFRSENDFLNAVVLLDTALSPSDLLHETQKIEREMGRKQKSISEYADRIIDIDILLYENIIMSEADLLIPHPLMTERDFVLKPLLEIAPHLVHPVANKTIADILSEMPTI